MELYLNGGYSKPGQYYLYVKSHPRLINRLADGLLTLHPIGPYTHNGNETGAWPSIYFNMGNACCLPWPMPHTIQVLRQGMINYELF